MKRSAGSRRAVGPAPGDPGLQPERTLLASVRTAMSFAVIALLGLRMTGSVGGVLLGIVAIGVAAVIVIVGRLPADMREFSDRVQAHRDMSEPLGRAIVRIAVLVSATACTGVVAATAVALA